MLFIPTNAISDNFDAVNSEELQNMVKKDLDPIPGAKRTGTYSILFTFEERNDVEWKYASAGARDTDFFVFISAVNAGGGGGSQDLQSVTDEGSTTTNPISVNGVNFGLSGISTGDVAEPWFIGPNSAYSDTINDQNGRIKPYKSYVAVVTQDGGSQAPQAQVSENNFANGEITLTRPAPKVYRLNYPATTISKVKFFACLTAYGVNVEMCLSYGIDADNISFQALDSAGTAQEGFYMTVELRIYD